MRVRIPILAWFASAVLAVASAAGQAVVALPTAETALLGRFAQGPIDFPVRVGSAEFASRFASGNSSTWPAEVQAREYFANGGTELTIVRVSDTGSLAAALTGNALTFTGLHALEPLSNLRLLIAPEISVLSAVEFTDTFAAFRAYLQPRRIFFILDPPPGLSTTNAMVAWADVSLPTDAGFCAVYFPSLQVLLDGALLTVPPGGAMAAIYARSDAVGGIWQSPSGTSLPIVAQGISLAINTNDSNLLVSHNVNPIRQFPGTGILPWAARTLDRSAADTKYIPIVRTLQWIAASIERSLAFAAAADDAEPLWAQIRSGVGSFLHGLWLQGAFVGSTQDMAYFVRCDASTTSVADIAAHRVNLTYGVAMLRALEFDLTFLSAPTFDALRSVPLPAIRVQNISSVLGLSYPTEAGFNYVLEFSGNLQANPFADAAPSVTGDGAWRTLSLPLGAGQDFYRLRIAPVR